MPTRPNPPNLETDLDQLLAMTRHMLAVALPDEIDHLHSLMDSRAKHIAAFEAQWQALTVDHLPKAVQERIYGLLELDQQLQEKLATALSDQGYLLRSAQQSKQLLNKYAFPTHIETHSGDWSEQRD